MLGDARLAPLASALGVKLSFIKFSLTIYMQVPCHRFRHCGMYLSGQSWHNFCLARSVPIWAARHCGMYVYTCTIQGAYYRCRAIPHGVTKGSKMGNKANKANAAQAAPVAAVQAQAPSPTLVLVPGNAPALRGARAAWYASIVQAAQAGQTVAQWQAAVLANPPSMPQRGKLAGQCEPPSGWLRWFTRNGYVALGNPPQA